MIQAGCLGLSFQNGQTTRKLRNFPPTTRVTGGSWFPNWGPCPQVGWGQDLYLRCHARSVPEFNMTPLRVCQEILTVQMTIPLNRMLMWWCDHTTPPKNYLHEEWNFFSQFFCHLSEEFLEQSSLPNGGSTRPSNSPYQRHTMKTYKRNFAMRRVSRNTCILYNVYRYTPSSISSNYQMPFENTIRIRLRRCFFFWWDFFFEKQPPRCHPSRRIPSPRLAFVPLDVQGIETDFVPKVLVTASRVLLLH